MIKTVQSTVQQVCVPCKGTGEDKQSMGATLIGIASIFIVGFAGNTHWLLGILALSACVFKVYSLATQKCKICNGTGTITSTSETIIK